MNTNIIRDRPEESVVKFSLLQGTARAISGKAAEAAKDKFRLNTPIAAIGVRGTDFVVSVSQTSVRAMVNQGAIVLAPYSAQCSALGAGPCDSNAVELDSNELQILEFNTSLDGSSNYSVVIDKGGTERNWVISSRRQGDSQDVRDGGLVMQNSRDGFDIAGEEVVAPETSSEVLTKSMVSITDVISESVTTVDLRISAKGKHLTKLALRQLPRLGKMKRRSVC